MFNLNIIESELRWTTFSGQISCVERSHFDHYASMLNLTGRNSYYYLSCSDKKPINENVSDVDSGISVHVDVVRHRWASLFEFYVTAQRCASIRCSSYESFSMGSCVCECVASPMATFCQIRNTKNKYKNEFYRYIHRRQSTTTTSERQPKYLIKNHFERELIYIK